MDKSWTDKVEILKIITIGIGVIDVFLTADSYLIKNGPEQYFIFIISISLVASIILQLMARLRLLRNTLMDQIDIWVHTIMTILVAFGAVIMTIQVRIFKSGDVLSPTIQDDKKYVERLLACALGFANAALYLMISFEVYGNQPPEHQSNSGLHHVQN